jgi:hypothetical protein
MEDKDVCQGAAPRQSFPSAAKIQKSAAGSGGTMEHFETAAGEGRALRMRDIEKELGRSEGAPITG